MVNAPQNLVSHLSNLRSQTLQPLHSSQKEWVVYKPKHGDTTGYSPIIFMGSLRICIPKFTFPISPMIFSWCPVFRLNSIGKSPIFQDLRSGPPSVALQFRALKKPPFFGYQEMLFTWKERFKIWVEHGWTWLKRMKHTFNLKLVEKWMKLGGKWMKQGRKCWKIEMKPYVKPNNWWFIEVKWHNSYSSNKCSETHAAR